MKASKVADMMVILLIMWLASICAQATDEVFNCTGCGLLSVPTNITSDLTKLYLSKNNITLTESDQKSLQKFSQLTELYLDDNNITVLPTHFFSGFSKLEVLILKKNYIKTIDQFLLEGLKNLKILDLSVNQLSDLPSNLSLISQNLQALYLQNNSLTTLDVPQALKEINSNLTIALSGNPWNCSCSLVNLTKWLNSPRIKLENDAITLCATPMNMKMKEAITNRTDCDGGKEASKDILPVLPNSTRADKYTSSLPTLYFNATTSNPHKATSWKFLVGVVVVAGVTLLLILFAIKFPRWYDFLLSYNHHRLKEDEPYMFEEEFNVDLDMSTRGRNDEDDTVVFEQTHSFVPEDDGFIEDKYIDERDITVET